MPGISSSNFAGKTHLKFSGEFEIDLLSGRISPGPMAIFRGIYTGSSDYAYDFLVNSSEAADFAAATMSTPLTKGLSETMWVPLNSGGTWTSCNGYFRICLMENSSALIRVRNLGIVGK
jgi:hypothetical protein